MKKFAIVLATGLIIGGTAVQAAPSHAVPHVRPPAKHRLVPYASKAPTGGLAITGGKVVLTLKFPTLYTGGTTFTGLDFSFSGSDKFSGTCTATESSPGRKSAPQKATATGTVSKLTGTLTDIKSGTIAGTVTISGIKVDFTASLSGSGALSNGTASFTSAGTTVKGTISGSISALKG